MPMVNISHLKAEYTGPDIVIGASYNKREVLLICTYDNGDQVCIPPDKFQVDSLVVHKLNENVFYAMYRGIMVSFVVKGKSAFTTLTSNRTIQDRLTKGEAFESRPHITKEQLQTYIRKFDGTVRKLDNDEYEITKNDPPYDIFSTYYRSVSGVSKKYSDYDELAYIEVEHGNYYDSIFTKVRIHVKPKFKSIFAWYEGFSLRNTKEFRPIDMIIIMEADSGRYLRIPYDFPGVSFSIIDNGDYTATVTIAYQRDEKSEILTYNVSIPIIVPEEETEDIDFKVTLCKDEWFAEDRDVTDVFREALTTEDRLSINWNTFMKTSFDYGYRGTLLVDAPKRTGLDNRFATVWKVICDGKTLKATVIKTYDKPIGGNHG